MAHPYNLTKSMAEVLRRWNAHSPSRGSMGGPTTTQYYTTGQKYESSIDTNLPKPHEIREVAHHLSQQLPTKNSSTMLSTSCKGRTALHISGCRAGLGKHPGIGDNDLLHSHLPLDMDESHVRILEGFLPPVPFL